MKAIINFYRVFFALLIALGIGLMFIRIKSHAESIPVDNNQKVEIVTNSYHFEREIKEVIIKNNNLIVNFNDSAIFKKNFDRNLFLNDEFMVIDFGPVDHYEMDKEVNYFLIYNLLMKSTIDTELAEIIDFNEYGLNTVGFIIYQDIIYAFGDVDDNAVVISLDLEGNFINQFEIGGEQKETFLDAFVIKDKLFLIGKKDSVSHNSELLNVGLPNTEKIFMISLDLELEEKIDEIYFNQIDQSEEYIDYLIISDYFYIQLNSCIFKINDNLELLNQEFEVECELNSNYYLITAKNKIERIKRNQNKLYINKEELGDITGEIIKAEVYNGNLEIYTLSEQDLNFYKISEYHIIKNEKVDSNRYNPEINLQNKLVVESYFENLEITINEIEPNLPKNIDGKYDITYKIIKEDGSSFLLKGEYELKSYVNIIDGGVYQPLKELFFYGYATLNGTTIYNGYKVKDEGSYTLILTNANGIKTTYLFQIIEGYYKNDECVTIESDIEVNKNSTYNIKIDYNGIEKSKIKSLWINGSKYPNFEVDNSSIIISLMSDSKYSIQNIHIDKIEYEKEGLKDYIINKNYLVKTVKDSPDIVLNKEIKEQKIYLDFEFNDFDKTLVYLKTEVYKGNNLIRIDYNYFNNDLKIDDINDLKNIVCKYYLVSYDGCEFILIPLMDYELSNYDYNKFLKGKFDYDYSVDELNITINPKEGKLKTLNVKNNNLIKNLKITNNNLNVGFIIFISISILIIGIISLFVIRKVLLGKKKEKIKYKI